QATDAAGPAGPVAGPDEAKVDTKAVVCAGRPAEGPRPGRGRGPAAAVAARGHPGGVRAGLRRPPCAVRLRGRGTARPRSAVPAPPRAGAQAPGEPAGRPVGLRRATGP